MDFAKWILCISKALRLLSHVTQIWHHRRVANLTLLGFGHGNPRQLKQSRNVSAKLLTIELCRYIRKMKNPKKYRSTNLICTYSNHIIYIYINQTNILQRYYKAIIITYGEKGCTGYYTYIYALHRIPVMCTIYFRGKWSWPVQAQSRGCNFSRWWFALSPAILPEVIDFTFVFSVVCE